MARLCEFPGSLPLAGFGAAPQAGFRAAAQRILFAKQSCKSSQGAKRYLTVNDLTALLCLQTPKRPRDLRIFLIHTERKPKH